MACATKRSTKRLLPLIAALEVGSTVDGPPKVGGAIPSLILLLLGACSALPPTPSDRFYRVDVPLCASTNAPLALNGVLLVDLFIADGLVGERPIVYGGDQGPNELLQYNYHYWIESPRAMLQDAMAQCLRAAKLAEQVVGPQVRAAADYELLGRVKRLEQWRNATPRVVVELELTLSGTKDENILLLQNYYSEVKTNDESVPSAVTAFNEAVGNIYARFVADVRAQLKVPQ